MKNLKNFFFLLLAVGSLALTGCLHILEEVTVRQNGGGNYQLTLDLSEMKGMVDMLKTMAPDSLSADSSGVAAGQPDALPMMQMQEEMLNVRKSLQTLPGISNINEVNDTVNFKFTYSFDFANATALNTALRVLHKEKYDKKVDDLFKFNNKSFQRLPSGDLGRTFSTLLAEGGGEDGEEGGMDMMKMFFADMTYKTVYRFPDHIVKKSSNDLSEISDNGHTLSITLKPFDEEQQKKNAGVGTEVKLKKGK